MEVDRSEQAIYAEFARLIASNPEEDQRTKAWHDLRKTRLTASIVGDIMPMTKSLYAAYIANNPNSTLKYNPKKKMSSDPSTDAKFFLGKLRAHDDTSAGTAADHGNLFEEIARRTFQRITSLNVHNYNLKLNDRFPEILGASPDSVFTYPEAFQTSSCEFPELVQAHDYHTDTVSWPINDLESQVCYMTPKRSETALRKKFATVYRRGVSHTLHDIVSSFISAANLEALCPIFFKISLLLDTLAQSSDLVIAKDASLTQLVKACRTTIVDMPKLHDIQSIEISPSLGRIFTQNQVLLNELISKTNVLYSPLKCESIIEVFFLHVMCNLRQQLEVVFHAKNIQFLACCISSLLSSRYTELSLPPCSNLYQMRLQNTTGVCESVNCALSIRSANELAAKRNRLVDWQNQYVIYKENASALFSEFKIPLTSLENYQTMLDKQLMDVCEQLVVEFPSDTRIGIAEYKAVFSRVIDLPGHTIPPKYWMQMQTVMSTLNCTSAYYFDTQFVYISESLFTSYVDDEVFDGILQPRFFRLGIMILPPNDAPPIHYPITTKTYSEMLSWAYLTSSEIENAQVVYYRLQSYLLKRVPAYPKFELDTLPRIQTLVGELHRLQSPNGEYDRDELLRKSCKRQQKSLNSYPNYACNKTFGVKVFNSHFTVGKGRCCCS